MIGYLQVYFSCQVLPPLRGKEDERFLRELLTRWSKHKKMIKGLSVFFHYLDKYLTFRSLIPVEEAGILAFYDLVGDEDKAKVLLMNLSLP